MGRDFGDDKGRSHPCLKHSSGFIDKFEQNLTMIIFTSNFTLERPVILATLAWTLPDFGQFITYLAQGFMASKNKFILKFILLRVNPDCTSLT